MFSVHTTPEKFENATTAGYFGFVFEELITYYRDVIIFEKLSFSIAFRLHYIANKAGVFKFLRSEERFRKASFS